MPDELFLSERHPASGRHAILQDDGRCGWLYLTEGHASRPVSDVWVFNRIPAPAPDQVRTYRPAPPPAAEGYAGDAALISAPAESHWSFQWAEDGEAVAVLRDGKPLAFDRAEQKHGFCRQLMRDGPWGRVWSDEAFEETFG
jgi:hypothetical protein